MCRAGGGGGAASVAPWASGFARVTSSTRRRLANAEEGARDASSSVVGGVQQQPQHMWPRASPWGTWSTRYHPMCHQRPRPIAFAGFNCLNATQRCSKAYVLLTSVFLADRCCASGGHFGIESRVIRKLSPWGMTSGFGDNHQAPDLVPASICPFQGYGGHCTPGRG